MPDEKQTEATTKEQALKDDGRYIIFFSFDGEDSESDEESS